MRRGFMEDYYCEICNGVCESVCECVDMLFKQAAGGGVGGDKPILLRRLS